MSSDLGVAFALVVSVGGFVLLVKLILDYRIKRKLIENNLLRADVQFPDLTNFSFNDLSLLKWAVAIVAVGIVFLIKAIVPVEMSDDLMVGLLCVALAIALFVSYLISKKQD